MDAKFTVSVQALALAACEMISERDKTHSLFLSLQEKINGWMRDRGSNSATFMLDSEDIVLIIEFPLGEDENFRAYPLYGSPEEYAIEDPDLGDLVLCWWNAKSELERDRSQVREFLTALFERVGEDCVITVPEDWGQWFLTSDSGSFSFTQIDCVVVWGD